MVSQDSKIDDAASDTRADAPRHGTGSLGREKLDVPAGADSTFALVNRLGMLNVGQSSTSKQSEGAASGEPWRPGTFGSSSVAAAAVDGAGTAPRNGLGWGRPAGERSEGQSLMEQMMSESMAARQEKAEEKRQQGRERTKKSFGGGLKQGFLSGSPASKRKTSAANEKSATSGTKRTDAPAQQAMRSMPVVGGQKASSGGLEFDISADVSASDAGFVIPEVQQAMKQSASPLGGGSQPAGSSGKTGTEWLTPQLLDKICEKPRLAAMLTDPRFGKAMQLMSTSPKEAMALFASNPEARDIFSELTALLAEHFTSMGEAEDARASRNEADRQRVAEGPLAQEAIRRAAMGVGVAAKKLASKEEQASVEKVLEHPELRALLVDPEMQRVLQECGEPSGLARYMRHPEYGPKLQVMARAGLVSFHS